METDITMYLEKAAVPEINPGTLGSQVVFLTKNDSNPLFTPGTVVIIGAPENRGWGENGGEDTPNKIRELLFALNSMAPAPQIIDAGNIVKGKAVSDTYHGMKIVISELADKGCIPVIIGGSGDLIYGHYLALQKEEWPGNYVWVDSKIQRPDKAVEWQKVLKSDKKNIFNYSHIGLQAHFASPPSKLWRNRHFEIIRLSECRKNLTETEPAFRDADFAGFSMNAVKYSDSPGNSDPGPNGFTGEEICQLSFYAGLSTRLKHFGVFDIIPSNDPFNISSQLAAQVIWYFLEGYAQRKNETPEKDSAEIKKYIVYLSHESQEIVFYKSLYSERWWMEVPRIKSDKKEIPILIACSPADYESACRQEIPDRWWRCFQKLN